MMKLFSNTSPQKKAGNENAPIGVCPNCMKAVDDLSLKLCPHCNEPLSLEEPPQLESAPELPHQRLRWLISPKTIMVAVLTMAVTLGLYGYFYFQKFSGDFYVDNGDRLMSEGKYSSALASYQQAAILNPQDAEAYERLGWVEYQQAHDVTALSYFEKSIALEPGRVLSQYGAGLSAYQMQNYPVALAYLNQTITLDPNQVKAYEYIGLAEYRLGEFDSAYKYLNTALLYNPDSGSIHYYLARVQMERGENFPAMDNLDKAEAMGFDPGTISLARGLAWMRLGNYESAQQNLQKAVTQLPARQDANLSLAKNYYLLGDYPAAKSQLAGIPPNLSAELQPDLLALLGWIALREGNYDAARDTFARLANLRANDADALNALGWTLFYSGDCLGAQVNFEKAAALTNGELVLSFDSFSAPNETPQTGLAISCPTE